MTSEDHLKLVFYRHQHNGVQAAVTALLNRRPVRFSIGREYLVWLEAIGNSGSGFTVCLMPAQPDACFVVEVDLSCTALCKAVVSWKEANAFA